MLPTSMLQYGENGSAIRQIFEYAKKRRAEIGPENVFDFSIGNPSVPAPQVVKESLLSLLEKPDSVAALADGVRDLHRSDNQQL